MEATVSHSKGDGGKSGGRMSRVKKQLHPHGIPVRLMDLLETDGGWLTLDYMAMKLDEKVESVERALIRLRDRGLVETRVEELASRPSGRVSSVYASGQWNSSMDTKREWRFRGWGEWSG